jgi:hypothetical protein
MHQMLPTFPRALNGFSLYTPLKSDTEELTASTMYTDRKQNASQERCFRTSSGLQTSYLSHSTLQPVGAGVSLADVTF